MFPKILNFFISRKVLNNYMKTIWLHFINSTVKTPKISLSPEMKHKFEERRSCIQHTTKL